MMSSCFKDVLRAIELVYGVLQVLRGFIYCFAKRLNILNLGEYLSRDMVSAIGYRLAVLDVYSLVYLSL